MSFFVVGVGGKIIVRGGEVFTLPEACKKVNGSLLRRCSVTAATHIKFFSNPRQTLRDTVEMVKKK